MSNKAFLILKNNGVRGLALKSFNYVLRICGVNLTGIGYYLLYLYKKNILSVDMSDDPFPIIYVNPENIQKALPPSYRWAHLGEVWEENRRGYNSLLIYLVDYKNARKAITWSNSVIDLNKCQRYRRIAARVENINLNTESRSPDSTSGSEKLLRELYENIRMEGYKSQREIHGKPIKKLTLSHKFDKSKEEIAVAVGPRGEISRVDGDHRLAIAHHLNIEEVPVHVVIRHSDWRDIREEIRSANEGSELSEKAKRYLHHPDTCRIAD
jgi:hypothetical protein